jgi:hypothetical protein
MTSRHLMTKFFPAMATAASIAALAAPAAPAMPVIHRSDVLDRYVANHGRAAAQSGGFRATTDTLGGNSGGAALPWSSGAAALRGGFDSAREAAAVRNAVPAPDVVDRYIAGHGGQAGEVRGYRFITDTLAPGGGVVVASPGVDRFSWRDTGVGFFGAFVLMAILLGARVVLHRHKLQSA